MNSTATPALYGAWTLDPQLTRDTVAVGDLPLARVLLMNDANFPWLIVVPRHPGAVEIFDLDADQRAQLMREVALLAQHLKEMTGCHKINIAAIGNVVSQLHVHVVARRRDDPAWPRPVWGALPARPYAGAERDGAERDRLIEALRRQINFI
jgi:diadenosine tetraphosphate (Ap4A) HIT family hydrolase